ncbi:hypothetical protein LIER_44045 [Lithospermum erythrorhizon]|uniref:Uncharacterized protein n=1 Tax=Lithospermum erythrorhizon TaxID=34254 RepID=A0AAV3NKZ7_LITER
MSIGGNQENVQNCNEDAARRNEENEALISLATKVFSPRKELIKTIQRISFLQGYVTVTKNLRVVHLRYGGKRKRNLED